MAFSMAAEHSIQFDFIGDGYRLGSSTRGSFVTCFLHSLRNEANLVLGSASRKIDVSVLILIGLLACLREPLIYLLTASVLLLQQHNHGANLTLHANHFSLDVCLDRSIAVVPSTV